MKLWSVFIAVLLGMFQLPALAAEIQLQSASSVMLPGGDVEMRLEFDAPPPSPKSYKIDQPPRIVMDLWGVENDMPQKKIDVLNGAVRDVSFAQVDGRLRVVVGLFESAGFKSYTEDNSLYVVVSESLSDNIPQTTSVLQQMKNAERSDTELMPNATRVTGVDFKRVSEGVGQVIISLSDDQAGVDIIEEGNNVVVNLLGAGLSTALEQRVDVQDFATPVQFIDAMGSGENATILVKPGSEPYNYLAYQAGNQLVIDFKPVTDEENAERQAQLFPYSGEELDLNFQDIELRSVLQIIAEVAELNLVVSDEVSGSITLRLKNVPWDQALDIVLKAKGLDKRVLGNVLLVAPAAEIAQREAAELENSKKIEELAPIATEYIQVDFRKASDMLKHVQDAKLVSERGFIMADDETNILMVRETDAALGSIRDTLKRFDVEVQQVLIEARLVTASSSASKDLGVRWGVGSNTSTSASNVMYGSSIGNLQDYAGNTFTDLDDGLAVDLGASSNVASSFAIGLKLGTSTLLGLELSALESDGKAEIISQPKILTMNGKTASIESGREIAYELTEDGDTSIEYKDVVLRLEVTPRINPGDRIAMDLSITQDSLGDETVNGYITIDNNELNTSVVVPDGQTIVLGGVFQNETAETVFKTPLLGDIPVVGNLFKSRATSASKSELLIFITPKLVRESLSIN